MACTDLFRLSLCHDEKDSLGPCHGLWPLRPHCGLCQSSFRRYAYRMCQLDDLLMCNAYIRAAIQGRKMTELLHLQMMDLSLEALRTRKIDHGFSEKELQAIKIFNDSFRLTVHGKLYCIPDDETMTRISLKVLNHFERNPDEKNIDAVLAVFNAVQEAYPCPKPE